MSVQQPLSAPVILLSAEFYLGRDEFAQALAMVFRQNGTVRVRAIAVWVITVAILTLVAILREEWRDPTAIVVALVALTVFMWLCRNRMAKVLANATLKAMKVDTAPGILGERRVQVTPDELLTASEITRLATRLDMLKLLRGPDVSVVLFPGGLYLPIPRGGNFGRENFESFCDKLQALIDQACDDRQSKR